MNMLGQPTDVFDFPASRSGKMAVGLIAIALGVGGLFAAMIMLVGGLIGDEELILASWRDIPMVAIALCGISAVLAALVAIVVEGERSVFVALALFVGLVITHASINGL